jgi:hypothetical protein
MGQEASIEVAHEAIEGLLDALERLLPQPSGSAPPLDRAALNRLVNWQNIGPLMTWGGWEDRRRPDVGDGPDSDRAASLE